ncbi:MAG TPA: hypothetical protein VLT89_02605 [Usitatibacter sp.]|nr:hypothetical protein [Usitatibacter sp.]
MVEITYRGLIPAEQLRRVLEEFVALQSAAGVLRVLLDSREHEVASSRGEIVNFPQAYEALGLDRRTRIAVIPPASPDGRKAATFYETACRNRGWNVRVHPDRDSAIAWLCSTGGD